MLTCLAPSKVWGIGVGFRSGLGRSLYLPCLGSLFYPTCVAWLACLEYLAGLYRGILRLPIGPLLGGHCLGSLQVQCEAWDTTGTTYFSFCDFRFSGLSYTQHVGGTSLCFLRKVVKQLRQASSQIWCALEHATSLFVIFPAQRA